MHGAIVHECLGTLWKLALTMSASDNARFSSVTAFC